MSILSNGLAWFMWALLVIPSTSRMEGVHFPAFREARLIVLGGEESANTNMVGSGIIVMLSAKTEKLLR